MAKERARERPEEKKKLKPVTGRNRKVMLSVLLVNQDAASLVAPALEPEHLVDWHPGYAALWRCCIEYMGEHDGKLPTRTVLREVYEQEMQDADGVDGELVGEAVALLRDAWKHRKELGSHENTAWAVRIAQRVSEEAVLNKVREDLAGAATEDLTALIARWTGDAAKAKASSAALYKPLFESGYISRKNVVRRTTYQPVLDRACGGGSAPGWVSVIAAPLGGGKTDMCASTAARFAKHHRAAADDDPVVVIFSFETSQDEYEHRMLAHLAEVPKDRIAEHDKHELRGMGTQLLEYERRRFQGTLKAGKPIRSEQKRVNDAIESLTRRVIMVDVSRMAAGDDINAGTKTSIEMMVATLKGVLRAGRRVHSVWIDHASAMIDDLIGSMDFKGDFKSVRTELLRSVIRRLRKEIALPFGCDVFLLAQLSGEANSRAPGSKLALTDLEGCKLLMMYADNGVFVGKYTPEKVAMVQVEKHRHNEKPSDFYLHFDGAFAEFKDVTETYEFDEGSRKIVKKEDIERAHAARRPRSAEPGKDDRFAPNLDF